MRGSMAEILYASGLSLSRCHDQQAVAGTLGGAYCGIGTTAAPGRKSLAVRLHNCPKLSYDSDALLRTARVLDLFPDRRVVFGTRIQVGGGIDCDLVGGRVVAQRGIYARPPQ